MHPPQYALVAYVRNSVGEFVEGLRRDVHPKQAHLPTHITILPPRALQGTQEEALAIMERVCREVEPFEVVLGEVATFMPVTPTIFIRLAHAGYRLRELHDRLNVGALYADESWPYMPHLTIAKMDSAEEAERTLETSRRRWDEFPNARRVLVDELTFVREAGPDRWMDLAPVPLGRRLAPTR